MNIGVKIQLKEEERIKDFLFDIVKELVPPKILDYSLNKEWLFKSDNILSIAYEKEIDEFRSFTLGIKIPYGNCIFKDIRVSFCYFDDGDEYGIGDSLWFSDLTEDEIPEIEKFIKSSEKKTRKKFKIK